MNIAYHYVDLGPEPGGNIAPAMLLSAKRIWPDCTVYHLTDEATPSMGDKVVRSRSRATKDDVMVHRLILITRFLEQLREPAIIVDPDVMFLADPEFSDCDLAFTWRPPVEGLVYGSMPINTGIMYSAPAAAAFWRRTLEIADALPNSMKRWFGDQMAIMLNIGHSAFRQRVDDRLTVDGVRIRLYPCETHNYTPEEEPTSLPDVKVMHFKGKTKEWLIPCAKMMTPSLFS